MGAEQSTVPEYTAAAATVTPAELEEMHKVVAAITGEPKPAVVTSEQLAKHFRDFLDEEAVRRLAHAIMLVTPSIKKQSGHVTTTIPVKAFIAAAINTKHLDLEYRIPLYLALANLAQSDAFQPKDVSVGMSHLLSVVLTRFCKSMPAPNAPFADMVTETVSTYVCSACFIVLFQRHQVRNAEIDADGLEKWLKKFPFAPLLLDWILLPLTSARPHAIPPLSPFLSPQIPASHLLNPSAALVLEAQLPKKNRGQWELLFSTAHHGESFSTFKLEIFFFFSSVETLQRGHH
jgi:hypothetical protein